MLKAKLLQSVPGDEITAILPIHETQKLLLAKQSGDVLVYSHENSTLKLTHTYNDLLKASAEEPKINNFLYSAELNTVFAQCDKSLVLLNGSNLNQYDKIIDKRGIEECWLHEQAINDDLNRSVLIYSTKNTPRLKMFLWNGLSFKSMHEVTLSTKNERVKSIGLEHHGALIVTSIGIYHWNFGESALLRIDKIVKPVWPTTLDGAIKELGCYDSSASNGDSHSVSTLTSSRISKKSSLMSFWSTREKKMTAQDIRYVFQPSDQEHPIILDARTKKIFQVGLSEASLPYLIALDHSQFFQWNSDFGCVQFLSSRFLLINNRYTLRLVDYSNGFKYLEMDIENGIKQVEKTSDSSIIVWTLKNTLELYKLYIEDDSDVSFVEDESIDGDMENPEFLRLQRKVVFCEAILSPGNTLALCESDGCNNLDEILELYTLKLRDLTVLWCMKAFEKFEVWLVNAHRGKKLDTRCTKLQEIIVMHIFNAFIKFLAPPELVISHCFPSEISQVVNDITGSHLCFDNSRTVDLPKKFILKWCVPYLTDLRRNIKNLQKNGKGSTIVWKYDNRRIKVGINFFEIYNHDEVDVTALLKIIDTVLFKIYLNYNKAMVGPLVRVDNMCDFEIVVKLLKDKQMFQELIDFYYHKKQHVCALEILTHLEEEVDEVKDPNQLEESIKMLVIDYLKKLSNDSLNIIFQYTDWLLERFGEGEIIMSSIFMNDSQNCANFSHIKVYEYIDKHDKSLSLLYLEYIIDTFNCKDSKVSIQLIQRYLEQLNDPKCSKKLQAVLRTTSYYEPRTVLRLLNMTLENDNMTNEQIKLVKMLKTYPLKKLGEHELSLNILINDLSNYAYSSSYCNEVYLADPKVGVELLLNLFHKLLQKSDNEGWKNVYYFLQEHGSKLNIIEILKSLPGTIPLKDVNNFLSCRLKSISISKNNSRIKRSLLQVELVNKNYELSSKLSEYTVIEDEKKCFICQKPLSTGASEMFSLFSINKKDVVTHYNCGKALEKKLIAHGQNKKKTNTQKTLGDMLQLR